jgi:hypothetical protein
MPNQLPVETVTLRHTYRVGACPVLEVTVTYPHIPHESPAATRFNEAYRSMAESFLAWADTAPAEEARASFAAMGSTAPYRFDRRILTCSMTAEILSPRLLTVTRAVTLKSRRGELTERTITAVDGWRIPELTAVKIPKKRIDDRLGEQA